MLKSQNLARLATKILINNKAIKVSHINNSLRLTNARMNIFEISNYRQLFLFSSNNKIP
jgi:hypothetical protein